MAMKISVKVIAGAKHESVEQRGEEYVVRVRAVREAGKANAAVIEALAEYFSVPKSMIRIVRGASASRKIIEIQS